MRNYKITAVSDDPFCGAVLKFQADEALLIEPKEVIPIGRKSTLVSNSLRIVKNDVEFGFTVVGGIGSGWFEDLEEEN